MPPPVRGNTSQPTRIAAAANGKAFFGTFFNGSGWSDLWELNLNTLDIRRRTDFRTSGQDGMVRDPLYLRASRDRSRIYFAEGNISSGPVFYYESQTDRFSGPRNTQSFQSFVAVNGDGSAAQATRAFFDAQLRQTGELFPQRLVSDFAFDPSGARGFATSGSQLEWVDTNRKDLLEVIGLPGPAGRLVSHPSGRRVFVLGNLELMDVQLGSNRPPPGRVARRLRCPRGRRRHHPAAVDLEGQTLSFEGLALPNGAELSSDGRLRYRPTGGQENTDFQAQIAVSDGP